jgi:protein-L-isoaspartate(D-aspartate) O-methyltransferase
MESSNDTSIVRQKMIREQLRARGIHDHRVLEAMARVPRERFVEVIEPDDAYADRAWSIDCGQTISQPYIVALMTEALALSGHEHVLEVGTGSGYQTAILAELAATVVSLERHAPLSQQAARRLDEMGYQNAMLIVADGTQGWPAAAPYDRVIVTAATDHCPPALFEQLTEGGILVIPIGDFGEQVLERIEKVEGEARIVNLTGCRFVPLVPGRAPEA